MVIRFEGNWPITGKGRGENAFFFSLFDYSVRGNNRIEFLLDPIRLVDFIRSRGHRDREILFSFFPFFPSKNGESIGRIRRIDAVVVGPVDRRTVDRSVVSFRAAAAVPRVRVRLAEGRPVFRLAAGGSFATVAESPSAATEPAPAAGSALLLQARDAGQLSK